MDELVDDDYAEAAQSLGCEVAAIKAIVEVECPQSAFVTVDGILRPRILFEAHIFARQTNGRFSATHPRLSSPTWNRALYSSTQEGEWDRLAAARALARFEADQSASWGKFQIMGFNHEAAGYSHVAHFVNDMSTSARLQMLAFVAFCKAKRFGELIAGRRWAAFAYRYNGAGYAANQYDARLAIAYAKHGGKGGG